MTDTRFKDHLGRPIIAVTGMGVITSLYFVGQKLIEQSTAIEGLEFLGTYAAAVLAFATIAHAGAKAHQQPRRRHRQRPAEAEKFGDAIQNKKESRG